MSAKTIKLYEQHVRESLLRFIQEEQAVNMYPEAQLDMPRSIALFDFSHAINVAYNAAGPDSTADIVIGQLRALRSSCDRVVLCLDSKPYRRARFFDGYKAGRKTDPELANIWDRVLDLAQGEGFAIARADGEEADDVMASLARIYVEDYACEDVRLVTADKDISQCINNHVRWFVPKLGSRDEFEIRDADWCLRRWGGIDWANEKQIKEGPAPEEIARVLSIMGDTSDRIPGIKGIGVKGAVWLVRTFGTPEKMAEGLVAEQQVAKNKGKELPAFWRNFAAGMAELPKWLQLTTVNDNVQLDKHPLKYLEHVEPRNLVEEGALGDADDSAFTDAMNDFEPPTAEELAEERAQMVASLPVDPAPLRTEPMPDPAARRAAMAAEADRVLPLQPVHDPSKMVIGKDPKADEALRLERERQVAEANTTPKGKRRTEEEIEATRERIRKANEAEKTRQAAPSTSAETSPGPAASPATASNGYVVPAMQGPPKPRREPEVETIAPPSWALATQPRSASEAFAIAKSLHNSRRYLDKHQAHEQLAAVILRGRELGIGMMTSIDAFHVIRGKVCASAQLISALAERDPNHEYTMLVELDERHALVEIKHKKQPKAVPWSYTIEEAEKLGLLAPSPKTGEPSMWTKRPKTMLAKTAQVIGHRFMFPAATLGLHALETELDGQGLVDAD